MIHDDIAKVSRIGKSLISTSNRNSSKSVACLSNLIFYMGEAYRANSLQK